MSVIASFLGFMVYVTGFLILLVIVALVERLWPAEKRNDFEVNQRRPPVQSVKYRRAS